MPGKDVIIKTKNVDVTYFMGKSNEVKALSDISIEINRGELVIFFGPSGCGKSTLLYSIAGLERHATGEIYVEGEDVVKMDNKGLEKHHQKTIGMIFQAFYLIPSLSVLQNIMMPQIAIGGEPKARNKRAMELAEYFGVGAQIDKLPTELSGGQQQRVAIARSLVNDPDIIFADEPVGNLDSKSATDVLSLIQDLNRTQKKTIILVTHDPSHLDIADKVVFLKDGKLVEVKTNPNPRVIKKAAPEEKKEEPKEVSAVEEEKKGQEEIDDLILEYKAREILLEVLTGMNSRQFREVEDKVKSLIIKGVKDKEGLVNYLDLDEEAGGAGFDKRKAKDISFKIKEIVEEMRFVAKPSGNKNETVLDRRVKHLRCYLIDNLDIKIRSTVSIDSMENIIRDRIQGSLDEKGVASLFDLDIKSGGVGLDKRIARKAAKMLELVLLGRYTGIKKKIGFFKKKKIEQKLDEIKKIDSTKK